MGLGGGVEILAMTAFAGVHNKTIMKKNALNF